MVMGIIRMECPMELVITIMDTVVVPTILLVITHHVVTVTGKVAATPVCTVVIARY
jgi:hypothetical protein